MRFIFALSLFVISLNSLAVESNYRVNILHPLKIYAEGSIEEAIQLSNEWRNKVLLKNPKIVDVEYLLEKLSEQRYDLLVIYHYKDKNGASEANQYFPDLIEQAWPDKNIRAHFFEKLQSYVIQEEKTTHRYKVIHNRGK